jgi:hypothetical protein
MICLDAYLFLHVIERIGGVDGEADENNVRVGIRKRAKTIVVFLARGIPQGEFDVLAIDLNIGNIVLKDSWDIDLKYRAMSGTESWSSLKWKCAEL